MRGCGIKRWQNPARNGDTHRSARFVATCAVDRVRLTVPTSWLSLTLQEGRNQDPSNDGGWCLPSGWCGTDCQLVPCRSQPGSGFRQLLGVSQTQLFLPPLSASISFHGFRSTGSRTGWFVFPEGARLLRKSMMKSADSNAACRCRWPWRPEQSVPRIELYPMEDTHAQ